MQTAFFFIGGMADLFLSVMMWFIFDNENAPTVFVDGERVYVVSDVIKSSQSAINADCNDEEPEEEEVNYHANRQTGSSFTGISKRMIQQFFHDMEGPDRGWKPDYDEVLEEGDRDELILENDYNAPIK